MPHATNVNVNKIRRGIVSDAAPVKRQGSIPHVRGFGSRQANIDRFRLHVQAILRDAYGMRTKILVAPRCSIAADHLDLGIGSPDCGFQIRKQIKQSWVVMVNFTSSMITQEMIYLRQRRGNVFGATPEHDVEPLTCMSVIEPQVKFLRGRLRGLSPSGRSQPEKREGEQETAD